MECWRRRPAWRSRRRKILSKNQNNCYVQTSLDQNHISAMSINLPQLHRKPARTAARPQTRAARFGEVWSRVVQNAAERRLPATKYLETNTLHLEALQRLEIPQNRQSFLWKCLERTSGNLEKLGNKLGGSPLFRHDAPPRAPRYALASGALKPEDLRIDGRFQPAVDGHVGAVDPARAVRAQEQDDGGDVRGSAGAADAGDVVVDAGVAE